MKDFEAVIYLYNISITHFILRNQDSEKEEPEPEAKEEEEEEEEEEEGKEIPYSKFDHHIIPTRYVNTCSYRVNDFLNLHITWLDKSGSSLAYGLH